MSFRVITLFSLITALSVPVSQTFGQGRMSTEAEKLKYQKALEKEKREEKRDALIEKRLKELVNQVLDVTLDPKEYIVGPGDLFSVYIWGKVDQQFEAFVSPEGELEIPTIGLIPIGGMSLEKSKLKIVEFSKKTYSGVEISISLVQLRLFRIYVTGNVAHPGTYPVRAVDRISDVIELAGGLDGFADGANVEVSSIDGSVYKFDYLEFMYAGKLSKNRRLLNGDVVHVPTLDWSGRLVTLETYDKRAGSFYLREDENLSSLFRRTGVFSKLTDIEGIYVSRRNGETEETFRVGKSLDELLNFKPKPGDSIIIPSINQMVYVTGEVRHPGAYPYIPDFTSEEYMGYAGGASSAGNGSKIFVIREGNKVKSNSAIIIRRGDTIVVPRKWNRKFRDAFDVFLPLFSIFLSAKAAGLIN